MSYKKIVSLFAVSALALGACATDDAEEEGTDTEEETEEVEEQEEESNSSKDLIDQAKGDSGSASPEYGLEVTGTWSVDGYVVNYEEGEEAVVPVTILTEKDDYNVYLLEDQAIAEVVSNEEEFEFLVEDPSEDIEYHVGVTPEELGEVGDDVSVDDFERSETILFEEAAEETDEEEE